MYVVVTGANVGWNFVAQTEKTDNDWKCKPVILFFFLFFFLNFPNRFPFRIGLAIVTSDRTSSHLVAFSIASSNVEREEGEAKMNDGDVSKQIQQMIRFIRQEAEEKANEISVSAEEVP